MIRFEPRWPIFLPPLVAEKRLKMGQNVDFRTFSEKSIHTIKFKLTVYTCWVSLQNWVAFGPRWLNFGSLVATKWLKIVISDHYLKKYSCKLIQTRCVHLLGECSELIPFWATYAKLWPSSGHKMTENSVSYHNLKKCSCNPIQTSTGHLLGENSELIHFGTTLAKYLPSSDLKMSEKSIYAIQFKHCVYTYWVSFQNWFALGHVGPILALYWPQNDLKWWFPTIIWKSIETIQFKLVVYTYCSELIWFWVTLAKFWPSSGHKIA